MRWFKHMTASWDDEKLARLADAYGLEGYGFWWRTVECVAAAVEDGKNSATYSAKKWGKLAGISAKKWQNLAEFCAKLELFSLEFSGNEISVLMPNILKFRDEWARKKARNSGAAPEQRISDTEADPEREADKEKDRESYAPAQRKKAVEPEKKQFGENGNVKLTPAEHDKLSAKFGSEQTQKAIAFLDLHIGAKGKDEYKNHNLALQKWVFDAVKEREARQTRASPAGAWKSAAQRRLEENRQAGQQAKEMLFGKKEQTHAGTGF